MRGIRILPLHDHEFALAYPLVRSVAHVELARWLAFARAVASSGGGVICARAGRECIYGTAAFLPRADLELERVLAVEILAAFELGRQRHIEGVLRAHLTRVAGDLGCKAVSYAVPSSTCWTSEGVTTRASEIVEIGEKLLTIGG